VGKSVGAVGLFIAGWWGASRLSRRAIGTAVARGVATEALGRVLHRWVMAVLLLAVTLVVLKLARVPLTAFAFLGGAIAIGVGFGTQNLIKNLISGVIILFERKVRVGDVVTIDGVSGTVSSVDLRATTVRGFDGIVSILPNSRLLESTVADWSHGDLRIRNALVIPVAVGEDARRAAGCLLECARAHPSVLDEPAPEALFDDVRPDCLAFRLQYWIRLGGPRTGPTIASDLRFAIDAALRERGVEPARALHEVRLAQAVAPAPARPAAD
jgi:small-conductance mechanosensitive channel